MRIPSTVRGTHFPHNVALRGELPTRAPSADATSAASSGSVDRSVLILQEDPPPPGGPAPAAPRFVTSADSPTTARS